MDKLPKAIVSYDNCAWNSCFSEHYVTGGVGGEVGWVLRIRQTADNSILVMKTKSNRPTTFYFNLLQISSAIIRRLQILSRTIIGF